MHFQNQNSEMVLLADVDKLVKSKKGLVCVVHDPVLSPLFIFLHFTDDFLKNNGSVIFVSFHQSANAIK